MQDIIFLPSSNFLLFLDNFFLSPFFSSFFFPSIVRLFRKHHRFSLRDIVISRRNKIGGDAEETAGRGRQCEGKRGRATKQRGNIAIYPRTHG